MTRASSSKAVLWTAILAAVVLSARAVVYALAPESALLDALAHDRLGPDVTTPLLGLVLAGGGLAAALLWLAATAVRERLALEGRRLVAAPPRLRPVRLASRWLALFGASALAFALLESWLHWREGLGWHGLACLTGPVHRDAIPVLAVLSLLAVAAHAAVELLLAWVRRLVAQLAARLPAAAAAPVLPLPQLVRSLSRAGGPLPSRGPPRLLSVSAPIS